MDEGGVRRDMRAIVPLALALVVSAGTRHDFARAVFVYRMHPDLDMKSFAAGKLGIPEPQHARIYLYNVYRHVSGTPLNAAEQRAWGEVWEVRADARYWPQQGRPAVRIWDGTTRSHGDPSEVRAAALAERVKRYGESSDIVRYFRENASRELPANAPLLARQDRAYLRAAGVFHQQRYDEAAALFEAIAADTASPWRAWGAYLAGRSLLWHARSAMRETDYDVRLRLAAARLRKVVDDPVLAPMHDHAERLLTRCLVRYATKEGLERVGRRLMSSRRTGLRASDLFVYLDAFDEKLAPMDPLSLWLRAFQSRHLPSLERGWKETQNRAWMLALISVTPSYRADLVDAALAVPSAAAGAEALHFHAGRLLAQNGEFERARKIFDGLTPRLEGFPSAKNRVAILRAQVSPTLDEFLSLAAKPVILDTDELDEREWSQNVKSPPLLDATAVWQMHNSIPAALLGARVDSLPVHLREPVSAAVRVRTALLAGPSDLFVVDLLKTPGARPYPAVGVGRGIAVTERSEMRLGWWTIDKRGQPAEVDTPYLSDANLPNPLDLVEFPPFVTAGEREQARSERARLPRSGYDYVAGGVVGIVKRNPGRPDNAALLERVILNGGVSWWTSGNESTGFREALQLLRGRYANTREGRRATEAFGWGLPR